MSEEKKAVANSVLLHADTQLAFKGKTVDEVAAIVREARSQGYLEYVANNVGDENATVVNLSFAPGVPVIILTEALFKERQQAALAAQQQHQGRLVVPGMMPSPIHPNGRS